MAIECRRSMVIAKLMGLDPQPAKQPDYLVKRCVSHDLHGKPNLHSEPVDRRLLDIMSPPHHLSLCEEVGGHSEGNGDCDVGVGQKGPYGGTNTTVDVLHSDGNRKEDGEKERMEFVLAKFTEAKRLSLDKELIKSKEFSDALEVLNSNCDLFLKFLGESDCQITRHLQGLQNGQHVSSQINRIALPKPNRSSTRIGCLKHINIDHMSVVDKCPTKVDSLSEPTRIVVLKPGFGRNNNNLKCEAFGSTVPLSSVLEVNHPFEAFTNDEARGAREVAKKITCQMQKTLSNSNSNNNNNNNNINDNNKRSETLSCLLSKESAEDSSLFDGSEKEYTEEEQRTSSDSQSTCPTTSQGSWEYVNRRGSHYSASSSSLTQATHLPESSIFREARRRLSERWLVVTSNKLNQEQKNQLSRSSSTLAEMLCGLEKREQSEGGIKLPTAIAYTSESNNIEEFPRKLQKSNSAPQSSSPSYENLDDDDNYSDKHILCFSHQTSSSIRVSVDKPKSTSSMSLLKGKVSSLFLSKKRRGGSERSSDCTTMLSPDINHPVDSTCVATESSRADCSSRESSQGTCSCVSSNNRLDDEEMEASSIKERLPLEELLARESHEEQEQPSPISVLQTPFEVDSVSSCSQSFDDGSHEFHQQECQHVVGSLPPLADTGARCLAFDETKSVSEEDEEQINDEEKEIEEDIMNLVDFGDVDGRFHDCFYFVKTLLSHAGLCGCGETSMTMLRRWHSPESPLDPNLLCKFLEAKESEGVVERSESSRSVQRLLFDFVNATLSEIIETGLLEACSLLEGRLDATTTLGNGVQPRTFLIMEVMRHVKEVLCSEETWSGHDHTALMDSVTRKHAGDSLWARELNLEAAQLGAEIQSLILDELVGEISADVL